jgi:RNA-directed DNA polymerase
MSRSEHVMTTAGTSMDEWKDLPWRKLERAVFKLQKRIYQASGRNDVRTVHRLQRLLMTSWSAKCLAVRRVTQDNRGKKTAGVDGVKSLPPPQRLALARTLGGPPPAQPLRRVWIPKPGTTEQRPLGIPTLHDRAAQALAKLALEPEWEVKFEANSYGFRPGRSGHDAIGAILLGIVYKPKFVLDADIAKCFDRINHQALLNKLNTFPALRRATKAWLQAGVMDGDELFPTTAGTPQGGVLSPLLANIALHGLADAIRAAFPGVYQGQQHWKPMVIRYADDFVVLHPDEAVIERVKELATTWLAGMGLELKPSKTRITHTLHPHQGTVGFDFLGFTVRQFPVGKTHSGKWGGPGQASRLLGFKTFIRPSKEAQRRHLAAIAAIVRSHRMAPQAALITRLNPLIRGWTAYYSTVAASDVFGRMSSQTFIKLLHWALRRHSNKPKRWVAAKYWRLETGKWTFGTKNGVKLQPHWKTPIRRHVKVRGAKSPFDGDWVYWARRLRTHPELPRRIGFLLWKQQGRCPWCGLFFRGEDRWEIDHRIPTTAGGPVDRENQQLLHGHCHDQKTARDLSRASRGAVDNGLMVEEPDAVKNRTSGSEGGPVR